MNKTLPAPVGSEVAGAPGVEAWKKIWQNKRHNTDEEWLCCSGMAM
jgi:hypothetical protein